MDGSFLIQVTVRVRQIAVSEGRTGDVDRDAPRQKAARYLRNAKEKCGRREPRTSKMQQARTTHSQAVEKVLIKKEGTSSRTWPLLAISTYWIVFNQQVAPTFAPLSHPLSLHLPLLSRSVKQNGRSGQEQPRIADGDAQHPRAKLRAFLHGLQCRRQPASSSQPTRSRHRCIQHIPQGLRQGHSGEQCSADQLSASPHEVSRSTRGDQPS